MEANETKPNPPSQHSEEWYEERRKGIGGSDSAAVLGKSRWKTPYQVWLEKEKRYVDENGVEQLSYLDDRKTNESMEQGIRREPYLIQEYADKTGKTVVQPGSLIHPDYDYVRVNLDGLVPGDRIIECKTSHYGYDWGEEGTEDVPISYYFQCQHGMMIAVAKGLIPADDPKCDLFVSIAGGAIRIYTIHGDPELWDAMLIHYEQFWGYVERNERPPLSSLSDLNNAYTVSKPEKVQTIQTAKYTEDNAVINTLLMMLDELRLLYKNSTNIVNSIAEAQYAMAIRENQDNSCLSVADNILMYKTASTLLQALKIIQERSERDIKEVIADNETLIDETGETLCTWKTDKKGRENFDKKKFKNEHPELYDQYIWCSTPSRRFLVK